MYLPDPVLVPANNDITVDLPTPCLPRQPTTRKSDWSIRYCKKERKMASLKMTRPDVCGWSHFCSPILPAQWLVDQFNGYRLIGYRVHETRRFDAIEAGPHPSTISLSIATRIYKWMSLYRILLVFRIVCIITSFVTFFFQLVVVMGYSYWGHCWLRLVVSSSVSLFHHRGSPRRD